MYRVLFILCVFTLGCISPKNLPEPETIMRGESSGEDILFVLYQIVKTEGIPTANMDNGMIKPGKLKEEMKSTASLADDDIFIIEATDESKNILKSIYVKNPLLEEVEYVKDDEGNMAVDIIEHDKKEIIARMNLGATMASMQLYYKETNSSKRKLIHSIIIQ